MLDFCFDCMMIALQEMKGIMIFKSRCLHFLRFAYYCNFDVLAPHMQSIPGILHVRKQAHLGLHITRISRNHVY